MVLNPLPSVIEATMLTVMTESRILHFHWQVWNADSHRRLFLSSNNNPSNSSNKKHIVSPSHAQHTRHRLGSGCGTAVEPTPRNIEVAGSNPAG